MDLDKLEHQWDILYDICGELMKETNCDKQNSRTYMYFMRKHNKIKVFVNSGHLNFIALDVFYENYCNNYTLKNLRQKSLRSDGKYHPSFIFFCSECF